MHRNLFALIATLTLTFAFAGSSLAGYHGDPDPGQGQGQGQGNGQGPPDGGPPGGQGGGPPENHTGGGPFQEHMQERRQAWQNLSEERREAAMSRAEAAGLFARFTADNGTAHGGFISFAYDDENGTLTDYTYHSTNDTTFFRTVSIAPYNQTENATARGATFYMRGTNETLRAHNNRVGLLHANVPNSTRTIAFTLADNVTISSTDNRSLALEAGDMQAHLLVLGNATLSTDNTTITVQTREDGGGALFMVRPDRPSPRSAYVEEAIKEGRLGAQMSLVSTNGNPVEDTSDYGVSLHAAEAGNGSLTVRAESIEHRGRVVTLEVHRDIFGVENAQDLLAALDGEAAERVATAREILANDPGERPTYHVEAGEDTFAVTFAIPHFSEREITMTAAQEEDTEEGAGNDPRGTPVIGIGVLLAVVGVAAAVAGIRRIPRDE